MQEGSCIHAHPLGLRLNGNPCAQLDRLFTVFALRQMSGPPVPYLRIAAVRISG